jgi:hypothetical protein
LIAQNHSPFYESIKNDEFEEKIHSKLSANKIYISSNQILTDDDDEESVDLHLKPEDHESLTTNPVHKDPKVSELEMEDIPMNYLSNTGPGHDIEAKELFGSSQANPYPNIGSEQEIQFSRKPSKCSELILSRFEHFNQSSDSDKVSVEDVYSLHNQKDLEFENLISEPDKEFIRSTFNTDKRPFHKNRHMSEIQSDIFMSTIGNNSFTKPPRMNEYNHTNIDLSQQLDNFINLQDSLASYEQQSDNFIFENSKFDNK